MRCLTCSQNSCERELDHCSCWCHRVSQMTEKLAKLT